MNKQRRVKIKEVIEQLTQTNKLISQISDEEEGCLNNLPDSLADGEMSDAMEDAIANLTEAGDRIDDAKFCLELAIKQ